MSSQDPSAEEYLLGHPPMPSKAERRAIRERDLRYYVENMYPYPLWAIEHYNKTRKEGEQQYKFTKRIGPDASMFYGELGILHVLYFLAQPISLDKSDPSASKCFYARVHEMRDNTHVPYCDIYPAGPSDSFANSAFLVRCEECGLDDREAFNKRSTELRKEVDARKLKGENVIPRSVKSPLFEPCNCVGVESIKASGTSPVYVPTPLTYFPTQLPTQSEVGSGFSGSPLKCSVFEPGNYVGVESIGAFTGPGYVPTSPAYVPTPPIYFPSQLSSLNLPKLPTQLPNQSEAGSGFSGSPSG